MSGETQTQTNVKIGDIEVIANESLVGKEGLLAVLVEDTNVLEARLPDTVLELALFVIIEGAAAGSYATLRPLVPGQQVRIRINGTANPGDVLKLAAINATDDGKVATLGTTEGVYFSPGVVHEECVDEQLALVDPLPRLVNYVSAHVADPASAAAMTQDTLTDSSGGAAATTLAASKLTGTLTGTANGALVDVAATAGSCAGGATPTATQVDTAIATAVATIVSGVNEQNVEIQAALVVIANSIASLAAQLAKVKTDVAAVRTGSEANNTAIDSIHTVLATQKITASS
jgi:hypothetical protein